MHGSPGTSLWTLLTLYGAAFQASHLFKDSFGRDGYNNIDDPEISNFIPGKV